MSFLTWAHHFFCHIALFISVLLCRPFSSQWGGNQFQCVTVKDGSILNMEPEDRGGGGSLEELWVTTRICLGRRLVIKYGQRVYIIIRVINNELFSSYICILIWQIYKKTQKKTQLLSHILWLWPNDVSQPASQRLGIEAIAKSVKSWAIRPQWAFKQPFLASTQHKTHPTGWL